MRIGAHVSSAGGIDRAVDRALAIDCDSIQVFAQSPRMWRPQQHPDEALDAFRARTGKLAIPSMVHALYLCNLASDDPEMVEKSVLSLVASGEVASRIGAVGTVLHVGSHLGSGFDAVLDRVAASAAPVLERLPDDTWLLLENTAGAGGTIGRTLDELARLVARLDHPRVGICLDSCHLYASGIDVGDPAAVDALVDEIDATMGLDRLRGLHLNDSQVPLGGNRDRHAAIGKGLIGAGLSAFLGHPRLQGLPATIETGSAEGEGVSRRDVQRCRRLWRAGLAERGQPEPGPRKSRKAPSGGSKNSGLTQPRASARSG